MSNQNFKLFLSLFFIGIVSAVELPNWITPCSRKDPEINSCIKENVDRILKLGKDELNAQGIVSIDPLFIDEASTPESSGAVSLKQKFTNFTFSGFAPMVVDNLRANFDKKCQIKMKNLLKLSEFKGTYKADGRLLLFQVKGGGNFKIELFNLTGSTLINCEFYEKNNDQYMRFTDMKFILKFDTGHLDFPNIVQNNAELSKTINDLLNDNFIDIANEYSPLLRSALEENILVFLNQLAKDIPVNKLFKDD